MDSSLSWSGYLQGPRHGRARTWNSTVRLIVFNDMENNGRSRPQPQEAGMIVPCPSCGQKNRLRYARLDQPARCGACGAAVAAPAVPLAIDSGSQLADLLA